MPKNTSRGDRRRAKREQRKKLKAKAVPRPATHLSWLNPAPPKRNTRGRPTLLFPPGILRMLVGGTIVFVVLLVLAMTNERILGSDSQPTPTPISTFQPARR